MHILNHFQTADGSNAVVIGKLGSYDYPMVLVGGNCSLQGYDVDGEDKFWTVSCTCTDIIFMVIITDRVILTLVL